MESYHSFKELELCETREKDYRIRQRYGKSGIAILAPHGGGIEPGTTEIAEAIAGDEHAFYTFSGLKKQDNAMLHITSNQFDEPIGLKIAKNANTILAIHGCKENETIVYLGGKDQQLKGRIRKALLEADVPVRESSRFSGKNPLNICNQGRCRMGVQLEVSAGLRRKIFYGLSRDHRRKRTRHFEKFVTAIQQALSTI